MAAVPFRRARRWGYFILTARVLLAGIFLVYGVGKLVGLEPTHGGVSLDVSGIQHLRVAAHQALVHAQGYHVGKAGRKEGLGQALVRTAEVLWLGSG